MSVDAERSADHIMRNMRRVPSEWEGLLAFTGEQLADGPVTPDNINAVYDMVKQLPSEELEANRYYGAGQVLCELGRNLMDPTVRQTIVAESGDTVARTKLALARRQWHGARQWFSQPPRFILSDLDEDIFGHGFFQPVRDAASALPAETRLLTDTLAVARTMRNHNKEDSPIGQYALAGIQLGVQAADIIHKDVLAGTLITYRLAYRTQNKVRPGRNPAVTAAGLRELDIRAVSAELASLHIDTLVAHARGSGKRNPMTMTADGELRVKAGILQEKPRVITEYEPERKVLHATRLRCPALHVIGLLPLVGSMAPDILEHAEDKVAAEWAARR